MTGYWNNTRALIAASIEFRKVVAQEVKEVMTADPRISLKELARRTGRANSTLSIPYYKFRRGEL